MLASHPKHQCHYAHCGFDFTCAPPWHFFGWVFEADGAAMREVARDTGTLLRVGERVIVREGLETEVEIWTHEGQTGPDVFWNAMDQAQKERSDGEAN